MTVSRVGSRHSQLAAVRPGVRPDADADVVGEQVAEDLADRAQALELVEDQADDRADLLVGVEVEPAVGRADVADRRVHGRPPRGGPC